MGVTPYLYYSGRCEEALSFYKSAIGAEIVFMQRYKDAPSESGEPMGPAEGVMHASLKIGDSLLLASDWGQPVAYNGFAISLSAPDAAQGRKLFGALSQGGKVTMPFEKQFWTVGFGMLIDRFGVPWMVNVEH